MVAGKKIRSNIFVNHFATDSIPEFSLVCKDMRPTVDASFLHIIRDPVENIASLYNHWDTFYKRDYFVEMAFARWEINLYSALRNKLLYPHGCDIVWYTSNKDEIRESLSASSIDLVRNMVNDCDVWEPTVFGQKLFGQSYKEKAGGSVSRGYEVENIFSVSQLEYLRREIDRVKEVLGVVKLKEVASEHYRPTHKLEPYLKMEPDVFNSLVKSFGETFQFIFSQHVNSERYMVERLRSATFYDLLKVAVKVCIRC